MPGAPTGLKLAALSDTGTLGDNATETTTPTITGTATAGDTIALYDGSSQVGTGTVAAGGTWSVATSSLTTGTHTLTAKQSDAYGDQSAASGTLSLTIVPVPSAPGSLLLATVSDSGLAGDNITDIATPTINGVGTAGDTIALYDGSSQVGTGTVASGGTWSSVSSSLTSGAHTLTAIQSDAYGDHSTASTALTLTIVPVPVAPSGLALAAASDTGLLGDDVTETTTPTINGTGTAGDSLVLYDGSSQVGTGTVSSGGSWSVATSSLSVGTHTLTATQFDAYGDQSAASGTLALTVVPVPGAPTGLGLAAASDSGTQGDNITDDTALTINGLGTAGDTVTLYDGATQVGTGTVESDGTWSVGSSSLLVGTHILTAVQTDTYGDHSPASSSLTVTIAAVPDAPTGLLLAPGSDTGQSGDNVTDLVTPSISGTGTAGDSVTLYEGSTQLGTAIVSGAGSWSVQSTSLTIGTHTLTAAQTDSYGDASPLSAALTLTIAAIPDAPTGLTLDQDSDTGLAGDNVTDLVTPTIDGDGTAGDTITLYDGTISVGTGTVSGAGAWSIATSALEAGTHTLTATQTDGYLDVSPASAGLTLTIAAVPDAPTGLALDPASDTGTAGDGVTDLATPTIDGFGTAGDMISLYDSGTLVGTSTVLSDGSWSVVSSTLATTTHTLTATQTDLYGDVSAASATLSLQVVALPDAPTNLTLDSGSDSGLAGDDITDIVNPLINGNGSFGDTVSLYEGSSLVGTALVTKAGTWSATDPALTLGTHTLTALQFDGYGDPSTASTALTLTIVAAPDTPAGLDLDPASDSGTLGDDVTDIDTPSITGTGTAGDIVSLYDGSTVVGTATVASDGSWSVTSSALSAATHTLTALQTDSYGDASAASAALTLTIAAAPGGPTGIALAASSDSGILGDNVTDDDTPSITGTGTAGDVVSLHDGSTLLGTTTVATDGTWSVASSALDDGDYTLNATQTDSNGDVSAASATLSLTIVAAPSSPANLSLDPASDTGILGDDVTETTTPVIDGEGAAGDTIALYDDAALVGTTTVGSNGLWSVTTDLLSSGDHTLTATQTDAYGNTSTASAAVSLTIAVAPDAPASLALDAGSDSGTPGDGLTDVTTPVINGTGTAGDTISLYDGSTLVGSVTVSAGGTWSVTSTSLSIGTHTLTATQTDLFGDASAASVALSLTIAAVPGAPGALGLAAASDTGLAGDNVTDITTPLIGGSGTAGDTIALYDGTTLVGTGTVGSDGTWSVATSALSVATHVLTATQTDANGNVSAASGAYDLTIAPVPDAPTSLALDPSTDSGTQGDDITDAANPTIDGSGTAGDLVALYNGQTLLGTAIVASDDTWSMTVAANLADGTHTLTAVQSDMFGNGSPESAALAVTIVAAPTAPASMALAAGSDSGALGDSITNVTSPDITGTGTAGDGIALYDGTTLVGTGTVGNDGFWSVMSSVLADGTHTLTALQTSPSGDISAASPPLLLTIDSTPPQAPTLTESALTTDPAAPVLGGAATSGDLVTIFQDGTAIGTTTAADGAWQFTYSSELAAGTYALTATSTDAAGNVSAATVALGLTVAADKSYVVVTPAAGTAPQTASLYSAGGTLTAVQTQSTQGLVLTSTTATQARINIYDTSDNLIGTVSQPTSIAFAPPAYATTAQTTGATTTGGTLSSTVNLLSEQNSYVSNGNADITVHAGTATINALGALTTLNALDANVSFYGGTGQTFVYGGAGQLVAIGGSGGGTLVGGRAGHNLLVAGGGTTTLVGVGGGDILFGSALGTDTLFAGAPDETLIGGGGTETIVASPGSNAFGGTGTTTMFAGDAGGSTLVGGSGPTVMVAGAGNVAMWAGSGTTTIYGGSGNDVLAGNATVPSTAILVGGTGNGLFLGGSGTTTAYGGTGNDSFFTGTGTMTVFAGAGQDVFGLGSGTATLHGGTGQDIYVLTNGASGGIDIIDDFKVGTDHLDLYGYPSNPVQQTVGTDGLTLTLTDGTTILLAGVTHLAPDSLRT